MSDEPGSFEFSPETAHPNAKALMNEDFYWSVVGETCPFGNDDGWDASQSFYEWRETYKSTSPLIFLRELIDRWQYPYFDWNDLNPENIRAFMASAPVPDENSIMEQIEQLKAVMNQNPDSPLLGMEDDQLKQLFSSSFQNLNDRFLLGQDNAIIATGFAQLALEGRIDSDLKSLTKTAITRQLIPVLIDAYDEDIRKVRIEMLTKMMAAIEKAKS